MKFFDDFSQLGLGVQESESFSEVREISIFLKIL